MMWNARVCSLVIVLWSAAAITASAQMTATRPASTLAKPAALSSFESTFPQLSPDAQCRINALRIRFRTLLATMTPATSASSVEKAALMNTGWPDPGGDVAEIAFVVLMEATIDQDKDLELIMAQTKEQTASKQALRDLMSTVSRDVAANSAFDLSDANALERVSGKVRGGPCLLGLRRADLMMMSRPPQTTAEQIEVYRARSFAIQSKLPPRMIEMLAGIGRDATALPPDADLAAYVARRVQAQNPNLTQRQLGFLTFVALEDELDSLNAMSETNSLRLQTLTDQRSKVMEALSNLLKDTAALDASITQNMK